MGCCAAVCSSLSGVKTMAGAIVTSIVDVEVVRGVEVDVSGREVAVGILVGLGGNKVDRKGDGVMKSWATCVQPTEQNNKHIVNRILQRITCHPFDVSCLLWGSYWMMGLLSIWNFV